MPLALLAFISGEKEGDLFRSTGLQCFLPPLERHRLQSAVKMRHYIEGWGNESQIIVQYISEFTESVFSDVRRLLSSIRFETLDKEETRLIPIKAVL